MKTIMSIIYCLLYISLSIILLFAGGCVQITETSETSDSLFDKENEQSNSSEPLGGVDLGFIDPPVPNYKEASVHDPSVMRVGNTYYVIGSHMASAKSDDLISWTQISRDAGNGNKLVPNIKQEMAEGLKWAETDTFWAGDWIQLKDGRFYIYYCNCRGDSPLGCIGVAVADNPEGPYTNLGIIVKSGMFGKRSPDGTLYDATKHPNAVDPHVFLDNNGKLWMVYGSYSGGIFIMEMDESTGLPIEGQGYGKKLLGGNHSRIEAPYILYSAETEYYYLFLSFGGLDSNGGYNIRICRSKNPDGPYFDASGNDMSLCKGAQGSFFDDDSVAPYGVKLIGNYEFLRDKREIYYNSTGYKSPGHNSAYYDEETGKYYLIFHTRFVSKGESHEIRVHQMFMNEDGWFVVAPKRYSGETLQAFTKEQLVGDYKIIKHGRDITENVKYSSVITLDSGGIITGAANGSWSIGNDSNSAVITIDGTEYKGVFIRQYDDDSHQTVMTFTALSSNGLALWGCELVF